MNALGTTAAAAPSETDELQSPSQVSLANNQVVYSQGIIGINEFLGRTAIPRLKELKAKDTKYNELYDILSRMRAKCLEWLRKDQNEENEGNDEHKKANDELPVGKELKERISQTLNRVDEKKGNEITESALTTELLNSRDLIEDAEAEIDENSGENYQELSEEPPVRELKLVLQELKSRYLNEQDFKNLDFEDERLRTLLDDCGLFQQNPMLLTENQINALLINMKTIRDAFNRTAIATQDNRLILKKDITLQDPSGAEISFVGLENY